MSDVLIFIIGLLLGSSFGIMSYAFLTLRKYGEMEDEIQRLRATRQILKEEIFRMEKNYKPRNHNQENVEQKNQKVVE